jgi:predicted negative regulator of RcsB-dependent stress response
MTVRQFLETKVFSPDNFPSLLTLGISLSFLEFCGVMGWRYWQRQAATAGVATSTTTVAKKITMNATTAAATTRRRVPPHVAYKYMGE